MDNINERLKRWKCTSSMQNEDALALAWLGQAYFELEEYKAAVDNLDKAMTINRTGLRRFYVYRGLANLELKNMDQAVEDLEDAR